MTTTPSGSRKPKRFLTAEQNYDLWVRMLTTVPIEGLSPTGEN